MKAAWRKLRDLTVALMKTGLSRRKVATTIALGAGVGVFPVVGVATPLLTVAALGFRLNLPLIHAANYLVGGLQYLLILPFIQLGAWAARGDASGLTVAGIRDAMSSGLVSFMREFAELAIHAALGWLLVMPLVIGILYVLAHRLLARWEGQAPARQVQTENAGPGTARF